jgi:hypothetical protein
MKVLVHLLYDHLLYFAVFWEYASGGKSGQSFFNGSNFGVSHIKKTG